MAVLLVMLLSTFAVRSIIPALAVPCEGHGASCNEMFSLLQIGIDPKKFDPPFQSYNPEDYAKGFHCDEAFSEWRRGWSWLKMKWCCDKEGIACGLMRSMSTGHAPKTQGDLLDPELKLTDNIDVVVEVNTATVPFANTTSGASMAFEIGTDWTEELELCKNASTEESTARLIRLPSWPNKMRVKALGRDAWGYSAIYLYFTDSQNKTARVTVLNDTLTDHVYAAGSDYWLDGDGEANSEHVYLVPELLLAQQARRQCTTRDDPRVEHMFYETSPAGTSCVFGVEEADEGSHCIYDNGQYGSFGWCYTSHDKSSWGSCSEDCPLSGQFKILGTKVDEVLRRLKRIKVPVPPQAKVTATTNQTARASNRSSTTTTAAPTSAAAVLRQLAPVERHGR
eukprot:TRINITY_DN927_c0_g1_i2.p1 TRINITY_DN927_c0_g1~~TRINITY_DN927_c0_g1_i2.p1  ORF type:complete len:395 (-),score=53.45 TRINITY_DN927_c0_g1_i2:29-1213(-)